MSLPKVSTPEEAATAYRLASDAVQGYEDGSVIFDAKQFKIHLGGVIAAIKWWTNLRDTDYRVYWRESHIDCLAVSTRLLMIWSQECPRPAPCCLPEELNRYAEAWFRHFADKGEIDAGNDLYDEMTHLSSTYDSTVPARNNFGLAMPPVMVGA